jgi:8-oxo-dGTP diphosphatase
MRLDKRAPKSRPLPFARPLAVAVDIVMFTVVDRTLRVLLTLRTRAPFKDAWSLPGGFVGEDESAERAAVRELARKTSVEGVYLEQLYTFSDPARDPRTRVVSIAYFALVSADKIPSGGGTRETRWFDVATDDGKLIGDAELAFDHADIIRTALMRIRGKLGYAPIGFQLLGEQFTLTELQQVYEAILGRAIDKRNFRSKLLKSGLVKELDAFRTGAHRPARLYMFAERTFE